MSLTGASEQTRAKRLVAFLVPFGVAASPDLTILPVALAASAVGGGAVAGVLGVFALLTMGTFKGSDRLTNPPKKDLSCVLSLV